MVPFAELIGAPPDGRVVCTGVGWVEVRFNAPVGAVLFCGAGMEVGANESAPDGLASPSPEPSNPVPEAIGMSKVEEVAEVAFADEREMTELAPVMPAEVGVEDA